MSDQVFGSPITDSTVQTTYPGTTNITAMHRADLALKNMEANSRSEDARAHVTKLKSNYGSGTSTLCTIYNASGSVMTFHQSHTWEGSVVQSPYPHVLQNGQWGVFLHVRARALGPSKEAVVYKGINGDGHMRYWVVAWNTSRMNLQNRVYTEISIYASSSPYFWDRVNSNIDRNELYHVVTSSGFYSYVNVGSGSSPYFMAVLSLAGLVRDAKPAFMTKSLDSEYIDDGDHPTPAATTTTAPTLTPTPTP